MNTIARVENTVMNINLINVVKNQVDELYQRQQIFGLSLETLELTRRFNMVVNHTETLEEMEPFTFNKLMALTKHLERNLVQELK